MRRKSNLSTVSRDARRQRYRRAQETIHLRVARMLKVKDSYRVVQQIRKIHPKDRFQLDVRHESRHWFSENSKNEPADNVDPLATYVNVIKEEPLEIHFEAEEPTIQGVTQVLETAIIKEEPVEYGENKTLKIEA